MTTLSDDDVRKLLKISLPVPRAETRHPDAWRAVRQKIDRGARRPTLWDCVLAAAIVLLCVIRPSLLGFLLIHL